MVGEKIYFDEEVKGHKLLVSSDVIVFKGKRFNTSSVDGVTTTVFRQSVNGIPTAATYNIAITANSDNLTVMCAGIFWFGKSQYERLRSAIAEAVGNRLVTDALKKLSAGETMTFDHKGSIFEKTSRFTLSRTGIQIEQIGMVSHKNVTIEWRNLNMQNSNGSCFLRCYSTGQKVSFQMWHMSNNMVFSGILNFMLDKANYRHFEKLSQ